MKTKTPGYTAVPEKEPTGKRSSKQVVHQLLIKNRRVEKIHIIKYNKNTKV